MAVFWLFYLAVPMVLTGLVVRWAQRRVGAVPESFGWATVLSALIGWAVVTVSGFPLTLDLAASAHDPPATSRTASRRDRQMLV